MFKNLKLSTKSSKSNSNDKKAWNTSVSTPNLSEVSKLNSIEYPNLGAPKRSQAIPKFKSLRKSKSKEKFLHKLHNISLSNFAILQEEKQADNKSNYNTDTPIDTTIDSTIDTPIDTPTSSKRKFQISTPSLKTASIDEQDPEPFTNVIEIHDNDENVEEQATKIDALPKVENEIEPTQTVEKSSKVSKIVDKIAAGWKTLTEPKTQKPNQPTIVIKKFKLIRNFKIKLKRFEQVKIQKHKTKGKQCEAI